MNTPLGRMSIFQPLDETTKAELITERLTQAIESGMLKNGEKLPGESEMAHVFAVSPITTREALEQLRSEDLVETRRGRDGGSFITSSPSRNIQRLESNLLSMPTMEIKDHRALYIALVSSSARLATEEASARERNAILEAIQSLVNDLETAGTENDNYLTHGHHEMQLHIEIAAATTSPHLVNSLIDLQDKLKHLLWLRFADKEQIDFLAKQYKYAAHLLSTNQDQLFERRITDIIKVGFSWLVERKLALQQQHVENTLSPTTPIEVSHQIHDLFNVYAKTLHDWEMEITRQTAHSIINKQEFDSLAERLTHPALEQDRRIIGAGLIPSPDFLPDAPWHSCWWTSRWNQTNQATIRPLRISDNPQSASFYNFTVQDWWTGPKNTDGLHITGPYIDYICSNEFTLTLSRPFYVDHHFAGMAGLDLSAATLEHEVCEQLLRLDRPAALISHEQRVLASTNTSLLCGDLVADLNNTHAKATIDCGALAPSNATTSKKQESLIMLMF